MSNADDAIRMAHAMEVHPAAGPRAGWDESLLPLREPAPAESLGTDALVMRVVYETDGLPDSAADYAALVEPFSTSVVEAASISAHEGVSVVALYILGDPTPRAFFIDGHSQ